MLPRILIASALSSLVLACASSPPPSAAPPTPPVAPPAATSGSRTSAPAVARREMLDFGRKVGTSEETTAADGTVTIMFDVLENGRGPHTDATLRRGPDGTPTYVAAKGHTTMGAPLEATFERTGNHVRWHSSQESGERDLTGPAFYVPDAPIPKIIEWLVQAALKNGGSIPLLPEGTARVVKIATADITSTSGEHRTVTCYAVTGIDLAPDLEWFNPDGSWFGSVDVSSSFVDAGWEPAAKVLADKQLELTRARDAQLARDLAHKPPAAGLAYTHARVLDVEHGKWLPDHTVVVVGDKITALGPSKAVAVPTGAEVVDLAGKALLPGLIDMHVHTGDPDGALNLASGVTTVRDVGNDPDKLDDYKQRYDAGTAIGPHVWRFGFIEGRNPKAASSKITAETPEEALAGVQFFVDRHYDGIKIYNSVRPELVPVITAAAHKAGLQVTGHIPVHMLANEAVRAGYDGIEHINMLFLNFLATHDTDTRDTTRFSLVGDKAADFDLHGQPMRDFIQLLVQHKTIIDPTADAFEDLLVGEQGKILPGLEATASRLPVQTRRGMLEGGLPIDATKHTRYVASYDKVLALVKTLYDAKVRLVLGTDAIPGLWFDHEIALFARAGVPNAAILRMATIDPARYMGHDKQIGSIAPGKAADLVVIDGDPLAKIDDISRTVSTMRGGVVFQAAAVFASVGVAPHAQ